MKLTFEWFLIVAWLDGASVTNTMLGSLGQDQMERVLYIKQEKITVIIYFFVHFNSTFTSLTAPQD